MKSRKLTFTAIAATLCLPLGAYAGGEKSHADKTNYESSPTASTEAEHLDSPHMGADRYITENPEPGFREDADDDSFAMRETETSSEWSSARESSDSSMQLTSSTDIKKVQESELRDKLTAQDLVGKTVVDRQGQEVGEVRAIALTSLERQQSQSSGSSSMASSQQGQSKVQVFIEPQEGDSLLQVPMSELSFNEQQEELRLDVAQSEIESLPSASASVASTD